MKENAGNLAGFKVGEYFVTIPPGDFIKEDKNGMMYAVLEIYKIDSDNKATKVRQDSLPKEVEEQISEELHKFLYAAIENEDTTGINK